MFPKVVFGFICVLVCTIYRIDGAAVSKNLANLCAGRQPGDHIPHPTKCDSYYMCARAGPVEFKCAGKLLFNRQHSVCDWPENVKCIIESDLEPPPCNGACNQNCCSSCNQPRPPCSCPPIQWPGMAPCLCMPVMCMPCPCPCPCPTPPGTTPVSPEITTSSTPLTTTTTRYTTTTPSNSDEPCWCSPPCVCRPCWCFPMCPPTNLCPLRPYKLQSNFDRLLVDATNSGDIVKDYNLGHLKFQPRCPTPKPNHKTQVVAISHPLWCNRYYICDHNEPIERRCPRNEIWIAKKKRCEVASKHSANCAMAYFGLDQYDNYYYEDK